MLKSRMVHLMLIIVSTRWQIQKTSVLNAISVVVILARALPSGDFVEGLSEAHPESR